MTDMLAVTAVSMMNSMERLDVISHNIANANTTGYKRDMLINAPFEYQMLANLSVFAPEGGHADALHRSGVRHVSDMNSGSMVYTGDPLHVSIEGKGFFQVLDAAEPLYSRDGSFHRDSAGRLVNARGLPVVGEAGEIHLSDGDVFIDGQAQIWQDGRIVDKLRIVDFVRPEQLVKRGGGLFAANGVPSLPKTKEASRVRQGYLETSNVAIMQEMVDLMSTLRHFEMTQHVVKGYDEMLGQAIESLGKF